MKHNSSNSEQPVIITETRLDLPLLRRGKVRDTYIIPESDWLLMVATDRLSAFDVVFNEGIPDKGQILAKLSIFWFEKTSHIIQNHYISADIPKSLPASMRGRSLVVKKAVPIMLECVVRGYITGSAWKEYQKSGTVCGIKLPEGLKNGSELPQPIFTPSTKAEKGHDENITEEQAKKIVGEETYKTIKQKSIELYKFGKNHALGCGLVLADTKFEFGHYNEEIILIDEVLTPDSSRYWLKKQYDNGVLESLDKQFVRDYLESIGWNKTPPPPPLPKEIIDKTSDRYIEAYKLLTGKSL